MRAMPYRTRGLDTANWVIRRGVRLHRFSPTHSLAHPFAWLSARLAA